MKSPLNLIRQLKYPKNPKLRPLVKQRTPAVHCHQRNKQVAVPKRIPVILSQRYDLNIKDNIITEI